MNFSKREMSKAHQINDLGQHLGRVSVVFLERLQNPELESEDHWQHNSKNGATTLDNAGSINHRRSQFWTRFERCPPDLKCWARVPDGGGLAVTYFGGSTQCGATILEACQEFDRIVASWGPPLTAKAIGALAIIIITTSIAAYLRSKLRYGHHQRLARESEVHLDVAAAAFGLSLELPIAFALKLRDLPDGLSQYWVVLIPAIPLAFWFWAGMTLAEVQRRDGADVPFQDRASVALTGFLGLIVLFSVASFVV